MIPRIIHQTWKCKEIPDFWKPYQRSWINHHPGWEYRLWTDEENLALVESAYPEYRDFYTALPYPILKVEFIKLLYLHRFGGLYVDLDFEALQPIDPLMAEPRLVMGRELGGMGKMVRGRDYIINALLASPAGHPFWRTLMERVVARYHPCGMFEIREFFIVRVVITLLDELAEEYRQDHEDIVIHPHDVFYAASSAERRAETRRQLAREKGCRAIHHYDDSWFSPTARMFALLRFLMHHHVLRRI